MWLTDSVSVISMYLTAYKVHLFFIKNIFENSPASYMLYVGLKFAEITYLATPISLDFRVTFICILSLFNQILCRLKVLSFIISISSHLILVLC